MRHLVLAAMLMVGFAFAACGGPAKPPMVPDDSTTGPDGGADLATPAPGAKPGAK
jgi:hypothetical protein